MPSIQVWCRWFQKLFFNVQRKTWGNDSIWQTYFLQRGCLNHYPFSESESLPASYTSIKKHGIMLTTPKSHPSGNPRMEDPGISISSQCVAHTFGRVVPCSLTVLQRLTCQSIYNHFISLSPVSLLFCWWQKGVFATCLHSFHGIFTIYVSKRMGLSYCHQWRSESKPWWHSIILYAGWLK